MAGDDGTELFLNGLQIDINGDNVIDANDVLNIGDNFVIEDLQEGDELTSSRPVQVDLVTGDIGDNYELRWYAQVDADEWTNEYITPVAEEAGSTGYWFYNPNDSEITISYEGGNSPNGTFDVAANSSTFIEVGSNINLSGDNYSGLRFFTDATNNGGATPNFYGLAQVDADGGGEIFDWGFPLIPTDQLTSQVLVGLGRGATDDGQPLNNQGEESRSVVWVTPIENSNIFIDFDGDGTFDYNESVDALDSLRIVDDTGLFPGAEGDQDLTGAIIVSNTSADGNGQPNGTPVSIAAVWGQDPPRSLSSDGEALDLGTAIVPLANPAINKEAVSVTNPDGTTDSDGIVDQVGDVINYEIAVSNVGFQDLTGVVVTDPLLANLSGPVESINTDNILQSGETWTYTGSYTVQESDIDTNGGGDGDIDNIATVDTNETPPSSDSEEVPINLSSISGNVSEDIDNNDTGDVNLENVTVELLDDQGTVISTTTTDTDGNYEFTDLEAGDYTVRQTNLPGYSNVSDTDGANDNLIGVTLPGDVDSTGNDFVDELAGTVSGHLYLDTDGDGVQDEGEPDLENVDVVVTDSNGDTQTVTTNSDGDWSATVAPGETTADVDENDPQYPTGFTQTEGDDPTTVTAVAGTDVDAGNDGYFNPNPDIELVKTGTLDLGENGVANPGDVINYEFKVTNTGNVTLDTLSITDSLDIPVDFGGVTTLAPGEMVIGTASYNLTQADIDTGEVMNTAEVFGNPPDGDPNDPGDDVTDTDDHVEPIPDGADIELVKTGTLDLGENGVANPGDVINYEFKVTNTGNVTLDTLSITDSLDIPVDFGGVTTLAPGEMVIGTASYNLTQADIDTGEVMNTAEVFGNPPDGDPNDPGDDVTDTDDHVEPI
ncbi:MAG: hypothetical protein F6K29_23235, partial [Okeania sp. SIO2G5]|nr:hypothetical protein [Okeania sp. SIO2G5]